MVLIFFISETRRKVLLSSALIPEVTGAAEKYFDNRKKRKNDGITY